MCEGQDRAAVSACAKMVETAKRGALMTEAERPESRRRPGGRLQTAPPIIEPNLLQAQAALQLHRRLPYRLRRLRFRAEIPERQGARLPAPGAAAGRLPPASRNERCAVSGIVPSTTCRVLPAASCRPVRSAVRAAALSGLRMCAASLSSAHSEHPAAVPCSPAAP